MATPLRAAWLLLLLLLLMLPAVVQAQFNFTTNNGTITITGYTGPGGAVTLPDRIPDTTNGLPVTSIGDSAFSDCPLTSVAIPSSVTSIGIDAFQGCTSLTNVTIGTNVTSIGVDAFEDCTSLTAITVDALNSAYGSVAGVLFNKSQTTLIQYPAGKGGGSYTITNSVTSIGTNAFFGCWSLISVTIPNSVTNIGDYAFYYCPSLTNVTIGTNVTSIGAQAFNSCYYLTSVTIPDSVTKIGDYAFFDCGSLTNVTIGNGVTSIGDYAFGGEPELRSRGLWPGGVTRGCPLTSVTIPNGVTNIGGGAFAACSSLTAITVDTRNSVYSDVDGVLFNQSLTTLVQYPGGIAGAYAIPNSVTNIGDYAFGWCADLTSATIPNGVTNIGDYAFYGCGNLTSVYFQGNAPSFGSEVFVDRDVQAVGPFLDPATIYFLPGTTGWDAVSINTGLPVVLWTPQVQTSDASFGVRSNQFGFNINWVSGMTVVVEACTNLANPIWYPLATNTLIRGSTYFSDPQWTNYPARFYRLRSP